MTLTLLQSSLAQEQERYIRLLERDLDVVREELRQAEYACVLWRHAMTCRPTPCPRRDVVSDLDRQVQALEDQLNRETARVGQLTEDLHRVREEAANHTNEKARCMCARCPTCQISAAGG